MAIAKLLEQRSVARMRATFTEANIAAIKDFDPELARKAQIAYDHKLPINFQQLEIVEDTLPRLLEEKKQLEAARQSAEQLKAGGPYELPKSLDTSACRPIPGQKDVQGTMGELAELMHPGMTAELENPQKQLPDK